MVSIFVIKNNNDFVTVCYLPFLNPQRKLKIQMKLVFSAYSTESHYIKKVIVVNVLTKNLNPKLITVFNYSLLKE